MNCLHEFEVYLMETKKIKEISSYVYIKDVISFLSYSNIEDEAGLRSVTKEIIQLFCEKLEEERTLIVVARKMTVLRSFFDFLIERGICEENPLASIRISRPVQPKAKTFFMDGEEEDLLQSLPASLRKHSGRLGISCSVIARYAAKELCREYGFQNTEELLRAAHCGGKWHDVGKLLVHPILLSKKDKINELGGFVMQQHPSYGGKLLSFYKERFFESQAQKSMLLDMVLHHHEQPDGKGYPAALRGDNVPLAAGICRVADTFDNRMVDRGGKMACSSDSAIAHIMENAGSLFTKRAVECFEQALPSLLEMYSAKGAGVRKYGKQLDLSAGYYTKVISRKS